MNRAIILAPRKHICKGVAVSTWGERLQWIVDKHEEGIVAGMARKVGKTGTQVSNYLANANVPSADVLQLIVAKYPNVNPEWLITGKGPRERVKSGETIPDRLRVAGEVVEEMVQLVKRYEAATSTVADDPVQGKLRSRRHALRDVAQVERQQAEPQAPPAKAPTRKRRSSSGGSDPG